jgi:hypothetical protein
MIDEEFDLTTDEALMSSLSEHRLEEKLKLEPYSLCRQAVATGLCGKSTTGLYNAVQTVWVCTLSEHEALKAHEDLEASRLKAFKWAEARGYSVVNFRPLINVYNRLIDELVAATDARIKAKEGANGETFPNAGGQPA